MVIFSDFIFSWIKDIVLLFVIITLIDLVMPKGNMARYIKFVIGLLIIFTVINPLTKIANLNFQLDMEVYKNINRDNTNLNIQNDQIEDVFKEKMAKDIIEYMEGKIHVKISNIDLGINKDEEKFGDISYLNIYIDEKLSDEKNIDIKVKPVILEYKPIDSDKDEFLEVKELLSDRYHIDKSIIKVINIK